MNDSEKPCKKNLEVIPEKFINFGHIAIEKHFIIKKIENSNQGPFNNYVSGNSTKAQCDDLLKTTYQNGQRFVRMHVVNKA